MVSLIKTYQTIASLLKVAGALWGSDKLFIFIITIKSSYIIINPSRLTIIVIIIILYLDAIALKKYIE